MKKIKILYTIPNFDTAGSGKVVYDLAKGLDREAFEVEIACGNTKGTFFKTVEALGLPIHVFHTKTPYRPYLTLPYRIWRISRFYKKHRIDVVHSWQWSSDWTEALAARLAGIKWMYTKKAMGFTSRHWSIKSRLADFIVTINDEMQAYFPKKKAQALLPLGIDTRYYSPEQVSVHRKEHASDFHIVMVANLVPVKGVEVLLRAVEQLPSLNLRVSIVGKKDNAYGNAMETLAKQLGVAGRVQFLGKQPDVRPFIAAADLYVIPTLDEGRKEGMPMALVEAMSMGVPVLGSTISGITFVLKDFPHLLFEAGNAEALADKISAIQALPEEERKALGASLRTYVQTHFTLERFIQAHEVLYQNLCGHDGKEPENAKSANP